MPALKVRRDSMGPRCPKAYITFVLGDFRVTIHFIWAETVIVFARDVADGATQLLSKLVMVFMVVLLERTSA